MRQLYVNQWYIVAKSRLTFVVLTFLSVLTKKVSHPSSEWIKDYSGMPNGTVIIHHYKKYMKNHDLADNDRQMLF